MSWFNKIFSGGNKEQDRIRNSIHSSKEYTMSWNSLYIVQKMVKDLSIKADQEKYNEREKFEHYMELVMIAAFLNKILDIVDTDDIHKKYVDVGHRINKPVMPRDFIEKRLKVVIDEKEYEALYKLKNLLG